MPDMRPVREWVQHDDVKKQAAAAEKRAKAKCAELEEGIIESFIEEGVDSIKVTLEAVDVEAQALDVIANALGDDFVKGDSDGAIGLGIVSALHEAGLLAESRPAITKTVFIGSRVWASPVGTGERDETGKAKPTDADYERACGALIEHGWGEYVQTRFNIISLSSAVNDEVKAGRIVFPEDGHETTAFDGTIRVVEKPQLNSRKAASK